ncbi:MAG TPA: hypothetical protein VJ999_11455 [Candidatus Sulfotelmatobacter sp.]|nr:hypothetical protein [Candidatus Sulfotelmatobacter sp.]
MANGHAVLASEAGRMGGLSRARRISAERRSAIARQARKGRTAKKRYGVSEREFARRYVGRIREQDPDLAWFVEVSLNAPRRDLGLGLIDLLSHDALGLMSSALDDVLLEVVMKRARS